MDAIDSLITKLTETIQSLSSGVASGQSKSFEEYKNTTGKIAGLKQALDLAKECAALDDD